MDYLQNVMGYFDQQQPLCAQHDKISKDLYQEYGVKAGLRDENGKGVLAGLTNISDIRAFEYVDGVKRPADGQLLYRGYDVKDLINGSRGGRFAFEEAGYLLLFGELPTPEKLEEFCRVLGECRTMPTNFTRDVIMKAPSHDIMNAMAWRSPTCCARASSWPASSPCWRCTPTTPTTTTRRTAACTSTGPTRSCPPPRISCGCCGRTCSTPRWKPACWTWRCCFTSSGTDTYSAMAAALCSLKGPRHGGANLMVMQMMQNIRENLHDQEDEEELETYLKKLLHGEAFDRKGLIYGMGHAVYSLSDPREVVFKGYVEQLAHEKGRDKDLALYAKIERMAPQLIAEERKIFKGVSPNVDFYSGFVYDMLGIPMELYTPLFAVARIMGWSAHRIEELLSANKIIRPAYKSLGGTHDYIPRDAR